MANLSVWLNPKWLDPLDMTLNTCLGGFGNPSVVVGAGDIGLYRAHIPAMEGLYSELVVHRLLKDSTHAC